MTHKIWVKMKHKYNSTHMKPYKCIRKNVFKPNNEKYEKVLYLGGILPPPSPPPALGK
jgi:hypothetical protein